ncbi:sterol desaturase family protein [Desulfomonile tiedjei]|uniref:Sterol desaturase n=1 Tax=Desulfomonile tiedjei (strain ATCC 49306 / DSM 6799 / DCB-1) TaxID=706587 RepID=I4C5E3_DESTA|nr:sterol desaturase [Desulfomonile tiedjei DSM 6799]
MNMLIIENEPFIRLGAFLGIFFGMALAELVAPRRRLLTSKASRWFANIGIVAINTVLVRLLFPVAAVGMAVIAAQRSWGLFNNVAVPYWMAVVLSVVILDFVIYLQHVLFHATPIFWRLHMMHHADMDFDFTTGSRFHPIEIVLSMLIKMASVVLIGAPAVSVIIFEVLLNATSMFNHANVRLPLGIDRVLRLFVVTPDMHRVHHSVFPFETNSNFGFNLPWWDRLMGTYRDQPRLGHEGMTIGLNQFRDPSRLTLLGILALPFVGKTGNYPINRRGVSDEDS